MIVKCKECGTKIDIDESIYDIGVESSTICPLCGETVFFTIPKPTEKPANKKNSKAQSSNKGQYKFCPECGTSLEINTKFCPNCGKAVEIKQSTSSIPQDSHVSDGEKVPSDVIKNKETVIVNQESSQQLDSKNDSSHHGIKWIFVGAGIVATIIVILLFFLRPNTQSTGTSLSEEVMENMFHDISMRQIFNNVQDKYNCFIVISKKEHSLKVYEIIENDTLLISVFPACLSKNKGQKQGPGDMKTPECSMEYPFKICQIQDASSWTVDFGDGRGRIRAYGHWFLRLDTGFDGIGIQGSTNNSSSVPGRASTGSVRLKDEDIIYVKEKYAYYGMKVIIKHEDEGLFGFEKKCIEREYEKNQAINNMVSANNTHPSVIADDEIKRVISSWDDMHRIQFFDEFRDCIYAERVQFYGKKLSGAEAEQLLYNLLRKTPDFQQSSKNIIITNISNNLVLCNFDKYTFYDGRTKIYPSYLYLSKNDFGQWRIIEESDSITDRNLNRI